MRYLLFCFPAALLLAAAVVLSLADRRPGLGERGFAVSAGMTRDEVLATLGPSPYPRGDWPTIGECGLGYPERCEHWEEGPEFVTVRFDPETGLVECKEVLAVLRPPLDQEVLAWLGLARPPARYRYYGGN